MKRTLVLLLCFTVAISPLAFGTTVGFGPQPTSRTVVDPLGATVGLSSLVWAGNFTTQAGVAFNPLVSISQNVTAITLAGGWEGFGVDTVTDATNPTVILPGLTLNATGKVGGTIVDNNGGSTQAAYFNNKSLYLWIFNASTVSAATQMGIFRSTDGAPAWTFSVNAGGVGDVLTYSTTNAGAPTVIAIGGAGSTPAGQMMLVAAVPEPSVLALGAMAGLGMLVSRKRRQRK